MLLYLTIFDFKAKHIFQATNYNYLASHKGQADCSVLRWLHKEEDSTAD